jgi:predicted membrane protein
MPTRWHWNAAIVSALLGACVGAITYFAFRSPPWGALIAYLVVRHSLLVRFRADAVIDLLGQKR